MRVLERRVPWKVGQTVNLYNLGDIHRGAKMFNPEAMMEAVDTIAADKSALWACTGDLADLIAPPDKRFRIGAIDGEYLDELESLGLKAGRDVAGDLRRIKDKCIGLVEGNHDVSFAKKFYFHVPQYVCGELGIPFCQELGLVRLTFEDDLHRKSYVVAIHHGVGGGATDGAAANMCAKALESFDADIIMLGHVHKKAMVHKRHLGMTRRGAPKVARRERLAFTCGAFLDTYAEGESGYGGARMYGERKGGLSHVTLDPETGEMEVHL